VIGPETALQFQWLSAGREIFPPMLEAIDRAERSIRLEIYIYEPGDLATRFLEAFLRARERGVTVRILIDSLGSFRLPSSFWNSLLAAGGQVRLFNPLSLHRLSIRNHRKSLICDDHIGFIGGFNIAQEYDGDGITRGWCDLGIKLEGPIVTKLASAFDEMFARADFKHKRFMRFRRFGAKRSVWAREEQLLLSGPGRGRNPMKVALLADLRDARDVQIIVAYFLPTWRVRHALMRVARLGGRVQLILAGKSDVLLSQLAGQSLYRRLLRAGVEIYEYQPQILHAKLFIFDQIVYAGSANLDQRSLNINYELLIRFDNAQVSEEARKIFGKNLQHCRQITLQEWRRSRSLWRRIKQRWAYFVLARLDPYIAQRQWKGLPE
jgi:cardiolipin synthase A/B